LNGLGVDLDTDAALRRGGGELLELTHQLAGAFAVPAGGAHVNARRLTQPRRLKQL
jgi:hypothetical protein